MNILKNPFFLLGNLPLISILQVIDGRTTVIFKKHRVKNEIQTSLSFSIITEKRTFDLEASAQENKQKFLQALHYVLDHKYKLK